MPITTEIEKAVNRVNSKKAVYADMVKLANSYINPEASLHLGEPDTIAQNSITPAPDASQVTTAPAATAATTAAPVTPVTPTVGTVLPNQSKNLQITEFEIHPEKPSARAKNPRKQSFGFTLGPIITVSRPNRNRNS